MTNLAWSISLSLIGVVGLYIAGRRSHWGWTIGLFAQLLWVVFAISTKQYGFLISAAAYGWVYGTNTWKWRREKRLAEENA